MMRVWLRSMGLCLALGILCMGCSGKEEPPPPAQNPKVVKRIIKSPPKEAETKEIESPAPAEKPQIRPEKRVEDKETPPPEAPKAGKPEVPVTPVASPAPPATQAGIYVVKKGESLSGIAQREDVYGDPLKWTILYRLNAEKLGNLGKGADLPDKVLSEGLQLKLVTPDEARKNLEKRAKRLWIVNILSATDPDRIVPAAVTLMQKGYPVYITSATVKGKDWMRLRLGFFDTRKSATAEGEEVLALLRFTGIWTTKASEDELKDYGRF